MSNYPDDMRMYDNDSRSPEFKGDIYTVAAKPVAEALIDKGMSENDAWERAYEVVEKGYRLVV